MVSIFSGTSGSSVIIGSVVFSDSDGSSSFCLVFLSAVMNGILKGNSTGSLKDQDVMVNAAVRSSEAKCHFFFISVVSFLLIIANRMIYRIPFLHCTIYCAVCVTLPYKIIHWSFDYCYR